MLYSIENTVISNTKLEIYLGVSLHGLLQVLYCHLPGRKNNE